MVRPKLFAAPVFLLTALPTGVFAQQRISPPATDTSALASPIAGSASTPATDASTVASPATGSAPHPHVGNTIAPGTVIHVSLGRAIDSGRVHNGQVISAKTTHPIATSAGTLPAGTPAEVTVVATAPAGRLIAAGEFSLELTRVGHVELFTDTQTYRGKSGPRDIADAAPALGTDAGLPAGAKLTFRASTLAHPENEAPTGRAATPGSVNGIASGSRPPRRAQSNSGEPTYGTESQPDSSIRQPSSATH